MTYSIKPGSRLKQRSFKKTVKNTVKYISTLWFRTKQRINVFSSNYEVRRKIIHAIGLLLDVLFTGSIIYYTMTYRNPFSYGLITALFLYYLEKIVEIIKKPIK